MKVVFVVWLLFHACGIIGGSTTTSIVLGEQVDGVDEEEGNEIVPEEEDDFTFRNINSNSKNENFDSTNSPQFYLRSSTQNININNVINNNNNIKNYNNNKKIKNIDEDNNTSVPPALNDDNDDHHLLIKESTDTSTEFTIRSLVEEVVPAVLSIDDGTYDSSISGGDTTVTVFLNQFQATSEVNYITGIQVAFTKTTTTNPGLDTPTDTKFDLVLFSDPDKTGNPSSAYSLVLARETVETPSTIINGEFVEYTLPNPVKVTVGDFFFAGLVEGEFNIRLGKDKDGGTKSWTCYPGSECTSSGKTVVTFASFGSGDAMIRVVYREPPSSVPTSSPTVSKEPSSTPSLSNEPSSIPSNSPSLSSQPSSLPSDVPSLSSQPSSIPSSTPSLSNEPSALPSGLPSALPSTVATSSNPTVNGPCPFDEPCRINRLLLPDLFGVPLVRNRANILDPFNLIDDCEFDCEVLDSTASWKLEYQGFQCGYSCTSGSTTSAPSPSPTPAPVTAPGPDDTQSYCEPDPRCNAGENPMYRPGSWFRRCEDDCVDSNLAAQTLDFLLGSWRCGSC